MPRRNRRPQRRQPAPAAVAPPEPSCHELALRLVRAGKASPLILGSRTTPAERRRAQGEGAEEVESLDLRTAAPRNTSLSGSSGLDRGRHGRV